MGHLDLYTLQHVVEFVIHAFFLDEKVLMLPVVYKKYKYHNQKVLFWMTLL
jgi:hypothetical protein